MKNFVYLIFVLCLCAMATSCNTERRAISNMRTLTEHVEKYGDDYSVAEWKDAYDQYKAIDQSIDKSRLTASEREEYISLQGRCLKQFASSSVSTVKSAARTILQAGSSVLQGILEGLSK